MTITLCAFTCGTLTGEFARLMDGGEGDITMPVPVFLIEHPKGRALFDTGLHPDCQRDPAGRLGTRLAGLFRIDFKPGEEISARLEAIDRNPGKIDLVITSHFHFDHVGGNALIPNATMLVQRREWDAAMDADIAARHGYNPRDFDLGHKLHLVEGEHDVFGDGSAAARSCSQRTPAISAGRCASAACRAMFMTARRCWLRSTGWRRWNGAGRASSSATTRNSGRRCRRRRPPSHNVGRRYCCPRICVSLSLQSQIQSHTMLCAICSESAARSRLRSIETGWRN